MKTYSKVLALVVIFVLAATVTLTGCGQSNQASAPAESTGKAEETKTEPGAEKPAVKPKVTFWTLDADDYRRGMSKCLPLAANDAEVEATYIPDTQYENKLRVAIAGNNSPDVISIDSPTLASYIAKGTLSSLDEFWDAADRDDLVNSSKEAFTYDGKMWAAPLNETNCVLYYNKEMFEKAGLTAAETVDQAWTWEQVRDAAVKLTQKDAGGKVTVYGILPLMAGPNVAHEGQNYVSNIWTWTAGADIISPDGTTVKGYFDSEKSLKALTFFGELFTKYKVAPLQDIPNGFQDKKIAMWITGPWMASAFDNVEGLKWGAMPLPKDEKQVSNSGGWSLGMSATAKDKNAAFKVISAITGKDGMREWCKETKNLPARKSLFADPALDFLQKAPYPMILDQLGKNAKARPVTPAYPIIAQALQKCFNDVAYGKDPAKAMAEYSKIIEDGLKAEKK